MNSLLCSFSLFLIFSLPLFSMAQNKSAETPQEKEVFCAMDVKLCPDGTGVGRDPKNNCKFKECPAAAGVESPFEPEVCGSDFESNENCSKME